MDWIGPGTFPPYLALGPFLAWTKASCQPVTTNYNPMESENRWTLVSKHPPKNGESAEQSRERTRLGWTSKDYQGLGLHCCSCGIAENLIIIEPNNAMFQNAKT